MILIIILILRGKGMLNMKSRFTTILMAVLLCLSVFGSVFCLAEHTNHECTGENCAVCAILEQCTQRLRSVAAAAAVLIRQLVLCMAADVIFVPLFSRIAAATPIQLKVKLLN